MKWGKWSEDKINTFIYELSEASEPPETRDRNSIKDKHGTKAYKGNKPKGLPWLINEAGYTEQGIKRIFEVIGIKIGKEQKEEFKKESLDPGAWRNGILAEVIAKEEFKPIDWLVNLKLENPGWCCIYLIALKKEKSFLVVNVQKEMSYTIHSKTEKEELKLVGIKCVFNRIKLITNSEIENQRYQF